ncbi:MAG: DUF5009 domain-containing protein, partial [Planctomycetota bacterium]
MQQQPQSDPKSTNERVLSIDALRGFDMFWIMGADTLAKKLLALVPATTVAGISTAWAPQLSEQFDHVEWEGFRFYDLIFPLFLMLVGCSIPFSLGKLQDDRAKAYWRILRRTLLIVFMGLIYNGIQNLNWSELR